MVENKEVLVVDTSVFIKWLIKETEGQKEAEKLKEDFVSQKIKIVIPSICLWEINNYLGQKLEINEATAIFSVFLLYHFKEVRMDLKLASLAFRIMKSAPKTSFYDASYHALALNVGGTYITADQKYYEQTKKWKNIRILNDYK